MITLTQFKKLKNCVIFLYHIEFIAKNNIKLI